MPVRLGSWTARLLIVTAVAASLGLSVPEAEAADAGIAALAAATAARVAAADVTGHLAPWLGTATRMQALLRAAPLAEALRERFDEDWWRNPRAGPWLTTTVLAPSAVPAPGDADRAARAAERTLA